MHVATQERTHVELAHELMDEFAAATGLVGGAPVRRYLWTDAFAVSNFLGLHRATGEGVHLDRALALVDQVHHVLGRHRPDDSRRGWLSTLGEEVGELHPTCGGLRIGKPLPERPPGAPLDVELEWERDGQYFHYLTQWMHALHRVGRETGQVSYHRWAIELAKIAHSRFVVRSVAGVPQRLVWKMSVELDRPLVASSGQHDALDAWLAYLELEGASDALAEAPALDREIAEARALCETGSWATDDPLGAGALLLGFYRLARLEARRGAFRPFDSDMMERLIEASVLSVEACAQRDPAAGPAERRVPFRELGLAIGFHALERLEEIDGGSRLRDPVRVALAGLLRRREIGRRVDRFWSSAAARSSGAWFAHSDINSVMLVTSLAPEGYLGSG